MIMTTFDDDFCQFEHDGGMWRTMVSDIPGLEWPPPPIIEDESESLPGVTLWVRESMSEITDDDRSDMTHVCRGAVYRPMDKGHSDG